MLNIEPAGLKMNMGKGMETPGEYYNWLIWTKAVISVCFLFVFGIPASLC